MVILICRKTKFNLEFLANKARMMTDPGLEMKTGKICERFERIYGLHNNASEKKSACTVMGLTFLAAGTSVPDLITSVLVAKQGKGTERK